MKIISLVLSMLMVTGPLPAMCADLPVPDKEYFIEAGDIINISVQPAEEFSKEVTVQPDGTIEIPLLGSMKAAGLRPSELQNILIAKFSKYVSNPSITVNVRKFSSSRIAIIGQINAAGYYEYKEGMRLLDLVALAGGAQDWAKTADVRIFRRVNGSDGKQTQEVFKADLESVMNGKMDKNIPLASGDIVYIPRRGYSKGAKWISDNFVPWVTLFTFAITVGLVARKN